MRKYIHNLGNNLQTLARAGKAKNPTINSPGFDLGCR